MPHSNQTKKRLRQDEAKRVHNRAIVSKMKTQVKKVQEALDAGDVEAAKEILPEAFKRIDKAAKTHVIHKNSAGHKKSLLARRINAAGS